MISGHEGTNNVALHPRSSPRGNGTRQGLDRALGSAVEGVAFACADHTGGLRLYGLHGDVPQATHSGMGNRRGRGLYLVLGALLRADPTLLQPYPARLRCPVRAAPLFLGLRETVLRKATREETLTPPAKEICCQQVLTHQERGNPGVQRYVLKLYVVFISKFSIFQYLFLSCITSLAAYV